MTSQRKALDAARQTEQLLQQTRQELEHAELAEQIDNAKKQLRKIQGMVESSEQENEQWDKE